MAALQADESYYLAPADEVAAAQTWRKMAAILGDRNRPEAETAYVTSTFCDDVLNAGWDASLLDRAAAAWRLSGERFVPTFGQLAVRAGEAKIQAGRYHLQSIRRAIDPPETLLLDAPTKAEPTDESMTEAQTLAKISEMEAQRTADRVTREGREPRTWGAIDEMFLRGLYARRDSFKADAA